MSISGLASIKYAKEEHDQSKVICEELKSNLKVNYQPIVTIGKAPQKEGSGKEGPILG